MSSVLRTLIDAPTPFEVHSSLNKKNQTDEFGSSFSLLRSASKQNPPLGRMSPSHQVGALATLVVQNSALALVMRFTRTSGEPAQMYIPTTAVVMAEVLKVVVALSVQYKVHG